MTLFKFGECEVCKQKCYNAKRLLHQFLPEDVCEKISEYNYPCECPRVQMFREKENKFMKEQYHKNLTIGEKQILFFTKYMDTPIKWREGSPWITEEEEREMKNEIDIMYENEKLKNEYADTNLKMKRLVVKSFMKKNLPLVFQIIGSCHCSALLSDNVRMFCLFHHHHPFIFRNQESDIRELIEDFAFDYVKQLIGMDKDYCDKDSINEWGAEFCMAHVYP